MKPSTHPLRYFSTAPRGHLFTRASIRHLSTTGSLHSASKPPSASPNSNTPFSFTAGPSPPRLPKDEQDIFDALQRASTGAFSTPRTPPRVNQSPDSSAEEVAEAEGTIESRAEKLLETGAGPRQAGEEQTKFKDLYDQVIEAKGKGEELHPNVVRGAQPEFEGERNPKTGEIGGPKNEPLRWGPGGEWSYNGRTTDF